MDNLFLETNTDVFTVYGPVFHRPGYAVSIEQSLTTICVLCVVLLPASEQPKAVADHALPCEVE